MNCIASGRHGALVLALAFAGVLAMGPALAKKDKSHKEREKAEHHNDDGQGKQHAHFESRHGTLVNDYYSKHHRKSCPPGLAKKNNGCQPPGQAKKWEMGQALPGTVKHYSVPQPLVTQLGQPPAGYKYVRVDSDILLMQNAGRRIVDAIRNFGRG